MGRMSEIDIFHEIMNRRFRMFAERRQKLVKAHLLSVHWFGLERCYFNGGVESRSSSRVHNGNPSFLRDLAQQARDFQGKVDTAVFQLRAHKSLALPADLAQMKAVVTDFIRHLQTLRETRVSLASEILKRRRIL